MIFTRYLNLNLSQCQPNFLKSRAKINPISLSIPSLDDFHYQEANTVDINIILEKPNISLYCLDFSRKWAIFVETDPEVDIDQFPFFIKRNMTMQKT